MHPQRTCCACQTKRAQSEFLRLASHKGAAPKIQDGQQKGRGAYLCFSIECARKAWKKRALERALKLQEPLDAAFKAQVEAAIQSGNPNFSGENPLMN